MASKSSSNRRKTRSGNLLAAELEEAQNTIFHDWVVFWNNQQYGKSGNLRIKVEDQLFHLHSHLLSFWSDYFDNLLIKDMKDVVTLPNCKKCHFDSIINFLYNGVLNLDGDNVKHILFLADEFRIDSITQACCNFIVSRLPEVENVLEILELLCRRDSDWIDNARTHIIERWNKIRNMDVLRTLFSSHLPNVESMVDILEFICRTNQPRWMIQIRTQIIRTSRLIYLSDLLRRVSINVLKVIISDEVVNREKDVIEVCHFWLSANIEERLDCIPELVNCISGENDNFQDFHLRYRMPLDAADIKRIFHELLQSYIDEKEKIKFLYSFELVPVSEETPSKQLVYYTTEQLYLRYWRKRMKILRHNAQKNHITVKARNCEYTLELWVLSISSRFFRAVEPDAGKLIEVDLEKQDFESVLNFMYGKALRITTTNLYSIIRANLHLRITSCEKLLHQYMLKNLQNVTNMFQLLNIYSESDQRDQTYNLVKNQILRNFSTIDRNLITCLRVDCLKTIVSSSILRVSQEDRLSICQDWVMHDILNRFGLVPELIQAMNRYFHDSDIRIISQFSNKLKMHLHSRLFANEHQNEQHDETNETRFGTFVGKPFEIRLPLLERSRPTRNTTREKKLQFGFTFYIKLPLLNDKSI